MPFYRITYRDIEMREAQIEADNEHEARELVRRGDVFDSSLIETESTELVSIEAEDDDPDPAAIDNTHEINPATGQPWPIEEGCCSYHYPARVCEYGAPLEPDRNTPDQWVHAAGLACHSDACHKTLPAPTLPPAR